jgi:hypothetical protein
MEENVEVEERRGKEVKKEEVETEEADARRWGEDLRRERAKEREE